MVRESRVEPGQGEGIGGAEGAVGASCRGLVRGADAGDDGTQGAGKGGDGGGNSAREGGAGEG